MFDINNKLIKMGGFKIVFLLLLWLFNYITQIVNSVYLIFNTIHLQTSRYYPLLQFFTHEEIFNNSVLIITYTQM